MLATIKSALTVFQPCCTDEYSAAMITTTFTINCDGSVKDPWIVDDALRGTVLADCVAQMMAFIAFPPFGGAPPLPVTFPISCRYVSRLNAPDR